MTITVPMEMMTDLSSVVLFAAVFFVIGFIVGHFIFRGV